MPKNFCRIKKNTSSHMSLLTYGRSLSFALGTCISSPNRNASPQFTSLLDKKHITPQSMRCLKKVLILLYHIFFEMSNRSLKLAFHLIFHLNFWFEIFSALSPDFFVFKILLFGIELLKIWPCVIFASCVDRTFKNFGFQIRFDILKNFCYNIYIK